MTAQCFCSASQTLDLLDCEQSFSLSLVIGRELAIAIRRWCTATSKQMHAAKHWTNLSKRRPVPQRNSETHALFGALLALFAALLVSARQMDSP
jgi:hypothetical protein